MSQKENRNDPPSKSSQTLTITDEVDYPASSCIWPDINVDELADLLALVKVTDSYLSSPKPSQNLNALCEPDDSQGNIPHFVYGSYDSSLFIPEPLGDTHSIGNSSDCDIWSGMPLVQSPDDPDPYPYKRLVIIDCRYPYEYHGGHIAGAINMAEWPKLQNFLFGLPPRPKIDVNETIFVLHCEFSSHRAPTLFSLIRNHDRLMHIAEYPNLLYPNLFILYGGYCKFYKKYPQFCTPRAYETMRCQPVLSNKWHRHCNIVNRKNYLLLSNVNPDSYAVRTAQKRIHIDEDSSRDTDLNETQSIL